MNPFNDQVSREERMSKRYVEFSPRVQFLGFLFVVGLIIISGYNF